MLPWINHGKPPKAGQLPISTRKVISGARPSSAAQRPKDDTRRTSCIPCDRPEFADLGILNGFVVIVPPGALFERIQ